MTQTNPALFMVSDGLPLFRKTLVGGMSTIFTSARLPDTFKRASPRVAALHTRWEQRREHEEGE